MKALLKNSFLLLLFRILIGFIFIFAGIEKIAAPESFAISIENYRILPIPVVNIIAISLPWIELVAGLLLVFGIAIKENIIIINSLLSLFIVLIIVAVIRGLDIDCGCFGTSDGQKVGILKIFENTGLFLLGLIVFYFDNNPLSLNKE